MSDREKPRPAAEKALEEATFTKLLELLETRPWPHRAEYLTELKERMTDGRSRSAAAGLVLANHASWQAHVHPIREEALELVLAKHPKWAEEALTARLDSVAVEAGLVGSDRSRYVERTAGKLREVPYVEAFTGPSGRFAPRGDVHSNFRAQDNIDGEWWEIWGELELDDQGVPQIRRLLIEPHLAMEPAGAALAPTTLRALRLPIIRERALRELHEGTAYGSGLGARASDLVELLRASPPKRGRASYPDELFELVAIHHVLLKRKHGAYGLNRRLARLETRMLRRPVPEATLKDWIREAEARDYLRKGPASREAGPRLRNDPPSQEDGA